MDEIALTGDGQAMFFSYPQTTGRHPRAHPQSVPNAIARIHEGIPRCTQNPHPL